MPLLDPKANGRSGSPWRRAAESATACLLITAIDYLLDAYTLVFPVRALLDELAHVTSAWIWLRDLQRRPSTPFVVGVLLGSVLIDADHIPLAIKQRGNITGQPRPYVHSLLVVLVLASVASRLPVHWRPALLGAALGVAAHLLRDMATGGVRLFWPLSVRTVSISYSAYVQLLAV
jgi:hypothetical protein